MILIHFQIGICLREWGPAISYGGNAGGARFNNETRVARVGRIVIPHACV